MGPEKRRSQDQNQDNQQCITLIQDVIIYPEQLYSEYQCSNKPDSGSSPAEASVEVALGPGQRYGWWEDHDSENSYEIATGCGAINDRRTRILLDTSASVSIVSLDLARRLSLRIRTHLQIKVSGMEGIPTYISAHARVKITLDWGVVYIQDVWIGNIGEGVDVLLEMNFMYSAGARLFIREGLVKLPNEENVVMYDDVPRKRRGLELPVCAKTNPPREVVWAGRGKRWVTEILFGVRSWATAKCLDRRIFLDCGIRHFPKEPRCVHPGKIRYKEWQRLILESTESRQGRMRAERLEQLMRLRDPPRCHDQGTSGRPNFLYVQSLRMRKFRRYRLQERPEVVEVFLAARRAATPQPEASALHVKDPTDVPVTTSEETGAVDTRDVGTEADFPRSCGYGASDRCSCTSGQPAKPGVRDEDSEPSTTGAIVGSAEDSERLRSAVDLREDLATFSRERDPEYHPSLGAERFASETNDVSDLNYYNKFIEDLPVVAAALYELDEDRIRAGHDLDKAKEALEILKRKITSTPLLRHPDCTKPFIIIPHANPWAACAFLGEEHEGIIQPVRFTGRVLNESELRYHIAEKEVLTILRVLEQFRPLIYGSEIPIVIYTRYSVLK
ncbi:hypothetical protein PHMEG_00026096 [Phytophthora megakarya]|uniref:Reverse transcriptase/retrotransposon-derived protein RNase H-like domain-containing protein n=1 Tax=Phytophthora megakarya TaxID=4795 RepID=A0A225V9E4_9STRA|nr:hypothetical protein PHMEG_00026096 [Phytophthora megakarya]